METATKPDSSFDSDPPAHGFPTCAGVLRPHGETPNSASTIETHRTPTNSRSDHPTNRKQLDELNSKTKGGRGQPPEPRAGRASRAASPVQQSAIEYNEEPA